MKYLLLLALVIFAAACTQAPAPDTIADTMAQPEAAQAAQEEETMEKTVVAVEETPRLAAPAIDVTTSSGEQFSLQSNIAEGKPTVVYFMASWCPTCAKNWAALNEVIPKYEDRVEFIAVSVDPTDDAATLQELAADKGFVFMTSPGNPALATEYEVTQQTAKFAIDAEGNIVERHDGALTVEEWDAFFGQLV